MPKKMDMTGMRFGNLVVTPEHQMIKNEYYWWCKCDCGTLKPIAGQSLRSRGTISCGCSKGKTARTRKAILKSNPNLDRKRQITHLMTEEDEYKPELTEPIKRREMTFDDRMDLARSMRKTFTAWASVAELCGDDVVAQLRGTKA